MSNLVGKLQERAIEHPDRVALSAMAGGQLRELTFAKLNQRVRAGAAFLGDQGIRQGDHVIFVHPVSIPLYEALLACMHVGIVPVFVDISTGRSLLAHACERMQPKAFFFGGPAWVLRWMVPALRRIPVALRTNSSPVGGRRWNPSGDESAMVSVEDEHPALVTFTSGSTGQPKAVVRSHGFLLAQHAALASAMQHEPGQRDLVTLPIFALGNLASGMTSVLADMDFRHPGKPDPARITRQYAVAHPQRCAASPAFFDSLLRSAPDALRSLQRIDTGGAPVFPDLLERLKGICGDNTSINVVYGSTEAEPISHFSVRDLTEVIHERIRQGGGLPVGRPVLEIEVAVIEDRCGLNIEALSVEAFDSMRRTRMESGEIVVRGPHVVKGYLDGIGDAEGKIRVGEQVWHRTGDAGYFDAEGNLWLLGRCSAADRRHGEVLYPFAVEAALRSLTGRPSAFLVIGNERCVCLESRVTEEERASLHAALSWAQIDRLVEIEALPMDPRHQAKIDYPALRKQVDIASD